MKVEQVKKLAEKYFGSIPAKPAPPRLETREPVQRGERRVIVEHTANPKLMIGFHKPIYPNPDAAPLAVLESILGGGRTSRLYKTVFEEKQLTAEEPRVYDGPGERYDNLMVIEALPRSPHTLEEVEQAVLEEIEKIKKEPVTERELQRVMNQLDADMIRSLGSNLGIAFQIALGQLYYGDFHANFRSFERIKKVTAADVQRVANEVSDREQPHRRLSGPDGKERGRGGADRRAGAHAVGPEPPAGREDGDIPEIPDPQDAGGAGSVRERTLGAREGRSGQEVKERNHAEKSLYRFPDRGARRIVRVSRVRGEAPASEQAEIRSAQGVDAGVRPSSRSRTGSRDSSSRITRSPSSTSCSP